jgi:hypothetical protein
VVEAACQFHVPCAFDLQQLSNVVKRLEREVQGMLNAKLASCSFRWWLVAGADLL